MTGPSSALHEFLDLARQAMLAAGPTPSAERMIGQGFAALARPVTAPSLGATDRPPGLAHLTPALAAAIGGRGLIADLAAAFGNLAPLLSWRRRPGSETVPGGFANRHASAYIVGATGLATADGAMMGVSVMAPGTTYPDHHHPPEELYIALSPGEWRQADGPWTSPDVGGLIHNPPNILHAMRSLDAPFLAFWLLVSPDRADGGD